MAIFNERLRQAMSEKSITQAQLSKDSGVGKSAISQYVSGQYVPKGNNLELLADALGVSGAWLMGYDDLGGYEQLNERGRAKVREYIKDILPSYQKEQTKKAR